MISQDQDIHRSAPRSFHHPHSTDPAAKQGRWIVVVDDDIDPTNMYEVLWAMSTRCDPALDVDILRKCWTSGSDPMPIVWKHGAESNYNNRAVIDACIPFDRINEFPKVAEITPEYRKYIMEKWGKVIFGSAGT